MAIEHSEIESIASLEQALADGTPLSGLRLQDLDLRGHEEELLARTDLTGLVVLGGSLTERLDEHLRRQGALIFPTDPHCPVNPYRAQLYSPAELYAGLDTEGYDATPDARAYHWAQDGDLHHDAFTTLLRAIHDDSITDALRERIEGARLVGVMGGHALARGTEGYAAAARLGHTLADTGLTVVTGGGPGAMEAANLGAFCRTAEQVDRALEQVAAVPGFRPSIAEWARVALDARQSVLPQSATPTADPAPAAPRSIGVPTWFYGHEPPNVFCDGIAKYFSNALREDLLLAMAGAGIIVLEGAAGTVQEVFQIATRLYYAPPETGPLPPLVLVGAEHWAERLPAWPLLQALGRDRAMGEAIHLVDSIDEAAALIR
ncbi:MAG: Rossmann fold nucleotide-binding protein [Micrococcales bacterium]|nr:Rossmann fold nucleotide-binding protein [Micrococcales bacterium]